MNKLEEDLLSKIADLKSYCNRKYSDKMETNKIIKSIEVQLKELTGDNKKKTEGDGWLIAKQPLKCFNCASCEANIKNTMPKQEYIPWNKYPQGERIYRMGQGFSHMLQMMTSEFVKTFEQNENNNNTNVNSDGETNQNNNNNNKSSKNTNTQNMFYSSEKSFSGMKINNKEQLKDETFNFYRTGGGGKARLPKMKKFNKKSKDKSIESIPMSDEEKEGVGDSLDKIKNPIITDSPKILKITKKRIQNPFNMSGFNKKFGTSIDITKRNKDFIDSKGKINKKKVD